MRTTVIRRTAVAASAVSLALLATACGGQESSSDPKGKVNETEAAKPVPAAKALTAAELEKLALVQGDVKDHKVEKAGPADKIAASDVTVDKAACKPVAYALSGVPVGKPAATVQRKIASEPKKGQDAAWPEDFAAAFDMTVTMDSLSSYDGKGAEEAVAGLRTAATDCAGGFTMSAGGTERKVLEVSEVKVSSGEDAVAWTVMAEQDGAKSPLKVAVVRTGTTLASFSSLNVASMASGKDYELPVAVIDAQAAKLG